MNPELEKTNLPPETQPTPEPAKKISGNDFFIRPLRTYEDDVKNAVQTDNISTAKILMAEQQRRQVEQADIEQNSPTSQSNVVKIIATIILIILGLGAAGGGYYYYNQIKSPVPEQITILTSNNFIDTESVTNINRTNKTNRETVGEIRNLIKSSENEMGVDTIKEIELLRTVITTKEGREISTDTELTTDDFFNLLEAREPDALSRSLDKKFLLGLHKKKESVEPFIIFKTNDYEVSYAKMLEWEYIMISDIKDIFFRNLGSSQAFLEYEGDMLEEVIPQPQATTSSSTEVVVTQEVSSYEERDFKDLILVNKDTRSISNSNGELLFFYTFINRDILILTTNSETLNIIINRLNSAQLIR